MRRRSAGALFFVVGLLTAGCTTHRVDQPPQIRYGEEPCAFCGMLISEERFATAMAAAGQAQVFDDLGCLLRARARDSGTATRIWVHDETSGQWLEAQRAWFVRSREVPTPMGGGLVAFSTKNAAEQFAREVHGTVVRFAELAQAN